MPQIPHWMTLNAKTIYNMIIEFYCEYLNGRTMVQTLLENFRQDVEGHLTQLFFSHHFSMALMKSFSSVIVMDCTYKIDRYKMPLLDIIGVSSFNTSF